MTRRRLVRLIPSVAVAFLILGPSSGTRLRSPVAHPRPSPPSAAPAAAPSNEPDSLRVREIARDTLVGPVGSEPDTAVEPYVAIDPIRPRVVVAVFQVGRFPDGGAAAIGFAASHDGGRTWASGILPGLTRAFGGVFLRASDPSVAFGPDGSAYASSVVIRGPGREEGIAVNRSDDGGRTWNSPVFLEQVPARSGDDFPRIVVDTASSSSHAGRVYVTYVQRNRVVVRWSDDRATSWSAIGFVSPGRGFVPNVILGADGALTVVYSSPRPRQRQRLVSRTSHDGATSFDAPVDIGVMRSRVSRGFRATGVHEAAADPATRTMVVVWDDATGREDGLNDVVLVRSLDGGATWTRPAKVNPDSSGSGVDHMQPAVASLHDRADVVYFTRAVSEGRPSQLVELRAISSTDGGRTFEGERTIGPPADLRFAAVVRPDRTRFLGDYFGVALSTEALVVVWCRSSRPARARGSHVTVWTATIAGTA